MTAKPSSLTITFSVWKALFLREAISRLSAGRAAWVWLLLEPMVHIFVMLTVYIVVRVKVIGGINTAIWLMVGMLLFFTFRRTATQAQHALSANQALFAYRQVKPVDAVLVRACLEGFLMLLIVIILFSGAALFGVDPLPVDPLVVLAAFLGLWMIGLGTGLVLSVTATLVPEIGKIMGFLMTPLYFASGVIFPLSNVPQPYLDWLLLNPLIHGLEIARLGFAPHYHAAPGVSLTYLNSFALIITFIGLALHNRFATKLVTQ